MPEYHYINEYEREWMQKNEGTYNQWHKQGFHLQKQEKK